MEVPAHRFRLVPTTKDRGFSRESRIDTGPGPLSLPVSIELCTHQYIPAMTFGDARP
jgi:hypothetical protein